MSEQPSLKRSRQEADARQIAIVTGGTSGIGLGIAHVMAKAGFALLITGSKDASSAAAVVADVRKIDSSSYGIEVDASQRLVLIIESHLISSHFISFLSSNHLALQFSIVKPISINLRKLRGPLLIRP
jgi:NAD(P)-dependent dehydrogenase (short-subunit alcohol dehydrogenase family)